MPPGVMGQDTRHVQSIANDVPIAAGLEEQKLPILDRRLEAPVEAGLHRAAGERLRGPEQVDRTAQERSLVVLENDREIGVESLAADKWTGKCPRSSASDLPDRFYLGSPLS